MRASRGSALVLVVVVACGGTRFTAEAEDAGAADVGDAGDERGVLDAAGDAKTVSDPDALADSREDADGGGADAGGDTLAAIDAGSEGGVDARADASVDAASDALADAPVDGPSDAPTDALEACAPTLFYEDGDGDGYGGTTTWTGCTPPDSGAWVTVGGDCDDSKALVNPGQTAYFDHGYVPTGQSAISFDYDCSGQETESGASAKASCRAVGLSCVGAGYLEASPVRSGPGVDPFCGSDHAVSCGFVGLSCTAGAPQPASAIACH